MTPQSETGSRNREDRASLQCAFFLSAQFVVFERKCKVNNSSSIYRGPLSFSCIGLNGLVFKFSCTEVAEDYNSFFQADEPLHLLSVPLTWVKEGGMVRLDKKYLQVHYKGVSTEDIIYTILASDGQPKYGTVFTPLI